MTQQTLSPAHLTAYFERIGYTGPHTATGETLRELHRLHPQAIAFENFDSLLGRTPRLDLDSLVRKLVTGRRGGYCFEHNLLFRAVLETLGFETTGLAARVLWDRPPGAMPARTHTTLLVETGDETWLADVGFGGMTPSAPLPFETGREQATPHETFRIALIDRGDYMLQVSLNGVWKPIYRFDLEPQFPSDYEAANHFVSTFPDSLFTNTLMVARLAPGRRYALMNRRLSCHMSCQGAASTMSGPRELTSVEELRATLTGEFGLELPDAHGDVSSAELDALLAGLPATMPA